MAFRSPALRFVLTVTGLVALAAPASVPLLSQAPPASELFALNVVTVKPDMMRAYVDLQKSEIIPALKKGGQMWRETWRTASFGDPFMFANVSPISGFDQYDGPSAMVKALGQDGYQALLAKLRPMLTSQRTYAMRTRPDLSFRTEGAPAPPMAILTVVHVQPTKLLDFEAFIKGEWIPAVKKGGGKGYTVVQVLYGGGTTEFHTLVGIDKYADLASHPVTKALGEDGLTKLMAKSGGFASSIERSVIRLDPELSFEVKAPSSK
jgi:hypothetical protein